ncbi:CocE/NonD family hydrolase [Umezawaea tangerina]|uniref:Xaa-Pro dipeptidyl-peptidase C-terminal domain-containing protein n=1 Tax=Umezawaea tangerina TaxID=84725 RepID=A0A2T0T184_9PSEU|nr:CocE/NonD family hydrolase [Umezawaea tangerina]PRY39424.1 hypothetical protein CLV43_1077 [Umezawaea tangerina]
MTFTVTVDVEVPTRDGTALATNVWCPSGEGPFPALLLRTPYGKDDAGLFGNPKLPDVFALVGAGYAIVVQDVRGTSRSPGTFVPHLTDGDDGVDTIAWLRAQPWCDGNIGTWGGSYMGFVQWQTAVGGPAGLRAMAPVMTSADLYRAPWYSPGGALSLDAVLSWGALAALGSLRGTPDAPEVALLREMLVRRRPLLDPLPVAERPVLRDALPWVGDVLDHPSRDGYWRDLASTERCAAITVPALSIGGWYDVFIGETVRAYAEMRRHGGSVEAREGQRLVIGPWAHPDGADLGRFPDRSFGPAGGIEAAGVTEAHLRFFDRWVRGRDDRPDDGKRVRLFVMGLDEWRDEDDWPLPDTRYTDYHLSSRAGANTAAGDGELGTAPPTADAHDTYLYDPRRPVPTLGGTVLATGPGEFAGPADQSPVEGRDDVLCFTTPVLRAAVEVTGHVRLVLHVSSSALDTDFTAKLVDVHPDGRAIILCEGVRRARYRDSPAEPTPLRAGEVTELVVDVGVTSNAFLPGHRIRLEVSSGNFPRYDRNTNTGGAVAHDGEADLVVAVNRVFHGPAHPSRLVLPVIDRGDPRP